MEEKPRIYYFRIIANNETSHGKQIWQCFKYLMKNPPLRVSEKQFTFISFFQRMKWNPFFGKRIIVIFNLDVFNHNQQDAEGLVLFKLGF